MQANQNKKLGGLRLAEQVNSNPSYHKLLGLEDGVQRVYLLHTGIFMMPSSPHTSIVVAHSLEEASQYLESVIISDFEHGRTSYWSPEVSLFGSFPNVVVEEKSIKEGVIATEKGFLEIRLGYFNPMDDGKPLFSYDQSNECDPDMQQNRIAVNIENSFEAAAKRLEKYGKSIGDILLSALKPGYVADILPGHWTGPPRR